MKVRKHTWMFSKKILLGALLAMTAAADAAKNVIRYRGDAYDLETGAFVYSENHNEFYEGDRHIYSLVSYRDKSGKEFAFKRIDFAPNRLQPTYELNDTRDGYQEGIRRDGAGEIYYARRKADQAVKTKRVRAPQPAVFDGGFDYFVRENFDHICSGKKQSFYFAVPIELDYFHFRVAPKETGSVCRMNLELDNMLLRQFVRPIKLWYDARDRRLRKYEGISNINGADGKSLKVRVVFTYPQK